jgi:hypothetical protein
MGPEEYANCQKLLQTIEKDSAKEEMEVSYFKNKTSGFQKDFGDSKEIFPPLPNSYALELVDLKKAPIL